MRNSFNALPLLASLVLSTQQVIAQDNCREQDLMQMKGGWKQRADANMRMFRGDSKMAVYTNDISHVFQSTFPVLDGMEAAWYRSMSDPVIPGGPVSYNFNSLYFSWYCNHPLHKMMLGDETGTWTYVCVNSLNWFITQQYDRVAFKVNDAQVFVLPVRKGAWKGYDLYQPTGSGATGKCIVLTHGGRVPWVPVTQEQYLQSLRAWVEGQKNAAISNSSLTPAMEEADKKEIERIQNNQTMKPETKQVMLNAIKKREDMYRDAGNGNGSASSPAAKRNQFYDTRLSVIDHYLGNSSKEQLGRPAVLDSRVIGSFEGSFSTEQRGGRMLVCINPEYFDKSLPIVVPQLMVLFWKWDNTPIALNFERQFEENFPVEKLRDMLDKTAGN